jgi:hypothetical protein
MITQLPELDSTPRTRLEIAHMYRAWLAEAPRRRRVYVRQVADSIGGFLFFSGSLGGLQTGVAFQFQAPHLCYMVLTDQPELDQWVVTYWHDPGGSAEIP